MTNGLKTKEGVNLDKGFVAYVFRPLRVIVAIVALLGIIGGNPGYYPFFIVAMGNILFRCVLWLVKRHVQVKNAQSAEVISQNTLQGE